MFFLSVLVLGFSSLVSQIVMIREMIVSFWGNEFFIGWILFAWLFWVAAGSLAIKFLPKACRGLALVLICHLALCVLFPLTVLAARLSKSFFAAAGQVPDFLPTIVVSFLAIAPLCLCLGVQFSAVSEWDDQRKAYLYEALGFVLGGLVFSYGLVFADAFRTCGVVAALNLAAVFAGLLWSGVAAKKQFFIAAMAAAFWCLACFLFSGPLNFRTAALRFPNEQLVETKNSVHGNLAVTRTGDQLNFYESGMPVGTDKDRAFNEYLVHLPMLSDAGPQKVLLIDAGFSGALQEILKYKPERVYYAQLDPAMTGLARALSPSLDGILRKGQVVLVKGDPRRSLENLPSDLDVVIINLPNPSTALLNRYFTDAFFREVRGHLKAGGVMATHLKFAADTIPATLGHLGSCIYRTIKHNFRSVVLLPGDTLFILASQQALPHDPRVIIRRLKARGILTYFLSAPAIVYRYTTDRIAAAGDFFKADRTARINTDLHPRGYLYNLIYWFSIFHQGLAALLARLMRTNYFIVLIGALGLILPFLWARGPSSSNRPLLIAVMAVGGFSLMAAEVIVIYGFQVFYGDLYYKIAWIIATFMLAAAAGTFWGLSPGFWGGNKKISGGFTSIAKLHAGMGAYFLIWFWLMRAAGHYGYLPLPEVWIILGAGIGVFTGLEFSYASTLFLAGQNDNDRALLGSIYAADLFGSCAGALGISVFMIPAYGIYKTLLLLMAINVALAAVISMHRGFNPKSPGFFLHRCKPR
ncbi:MAG: hypothetical protein KGJ09_02540 [Candidatus Omnitrophica bacterium]|nr:hypothetical protein [Candidatus Omnitrophota bacterium]